MYNVHCTAYTVLWLSVQWTVLHYFLRFLDSTVPIVHGQCDFYSVERSTVSARWIFFWRSKQFSQFFLCMRWWFLMSSKSLSPPYTFFIILFASLKLLTNFENACWNSFRIPFSVSGLYSLLPTSHWQQGNPQRIDFSQAAFGIICIQISLFIYFFSFIT